MKNFTLLFMLFMLPFFMKAQWTSVYDTDNTEFLNLQFFDANTGYVIGGTSSTPYVLKTTDGGDSWTNKNTGLANEKVKSIAFQNINTGFVTTFGGKLFKTENAADNWTEVIPEEYTDIYGVNYAGNYSGNDVYYAYGNDKLFKTDNLGGTWTTAYTESYWIFYRSCEANGNGLEFYN